MGLSINGNLPQDKCISETGPRDLILHLTSQANKIQPVCGGEGFFIFLLLNMNFYANERAFWMPLVPNTISLNTAEKPPLDIQPSQVWKRGLKSCVWLFQILVVQNTYPHLLHCRLHLHCKTPRLWWVVSSSISEWGQCSWAPPAAPSSWHSLATVGACRPDTPCH